MSKLRVPVRTLIGDGRDIVIITYYKNKHCELIYIIQEELAMHAMAVDQTFYEENCKQNYVWDQTGGCIPFKGVIRIHTQMFRVCIQIWVKIMVIATELT